MRLAIVAAIAYGCRASGDCTNDKWSMPAQTLEGSGTMVIVNAGGKLGNTTVPPTNTTTQMDMFQSFDYEKMNIVQRMSQHMDVSGMHTQVESDMILHWKAGTMTMHTKSSDGSIDHCTTTKLPMYMRFLPVGKLMEKLKTLEAGFLKCVGHHDDLDTFRARMNFPPKWLPKAMTAKSAHVNYTMDIDVDAAGLMKSLKLDEGVSMDVRTTSPSGKKETMHSESRILQDMTVSKSRAGGPELWDLMVPKKWNCSTVHMPELEDLMAKWERSDSPFFGHTRLIQHTLRALMMEAKASEVLV